MSYNLSFTESAKKKEYDKLDSNIRDQFKKKLKQILENPKIPKKTRLAVLMLPICTKSNSRPLVIDCCMRALIMKLWFW